MTEVNVTGDMRKPGELVFVPGKSESGKIKPVKTKIGATVIKMDTRGIGVTYEDIEGRRLPELMFDDPWKCQEAVDILDRYAKQVDQELQALKDKIKKEREDKCQKPKDPQ